MSANRDHLLRRMEAQVASAAGAAAFARMSALLNGLAGFPVLARQGLRAWLERDAESFAWTAFARLHRGGLDPAQEALLRQMTSEETVVAAALAHPKAYSEADAQEFARAWAELDPQFAARLLKRALPEGVHQAREVDGAQAGRVLQLVEFIGFWGRLDLALLRLSRHSSPRVRARATRLLVRGAIQSSWLDAQLADPDPRVRADLIQGLWTAPPSSRVRAIFERAATDRHHRVAANALVGLHKAGAPGAAGRVLGMAANPDPLFQAAACWAMGVICEERFLAVLGGLAKSANGVVRRNAIRAMVSIRKRMGSPAGPLPVACESGSHASVNNGPA